MSRTRLKRLVLAVAISLTAALALAQSYRPVNASGVITVTRADDGTNCGPQPLGETLRCAINEANTLGPNNTIQFAPSITRVVLTSGLPAITSPGTFLNGALPSTFVAIDAAAIGDRPLEIDADDVLIFEVGIMNGPSTAADIQINRGKRVQISYSYIGMAPLTLTCGFPGHTRNSRVGIEVASQDGNSGAATAYIFGNTIGCHTASGDGAGIHIRTSWTVVGVDLSGNSSANQIGGASFSYAFGNDHGITLESIAGVVTTSNNTILGNVVADNLIDGIVLSGPATFGNLISGTLISGNQYNGICQNAGAHDNVWSHLSVARSGGLGVEANGNCYAANNPHTTVDPPFPVITGVDPGTGAVNGTGTSSLNPCLSSCTTVELYRVWPNASGFGEGRTFVGATHTDTNGHWQLIDPEFSGGCYTAFETTSVFLFSGSHTYSGEYGPNNCRLSLPLLER